MAEPLAYRLDAKIDDGEENTVDVEQTAHAQAVAEYLADMVGQLESMARLAGLDLLVYLLSMARVEAQTSARSAQTAARRPVS
jgi:hypothetical protein